MAHFLLDTGREGGAMKRWSGLSAAVACLAFAVACGGANREENAATEREGTAAENQAITDERTGGTPEAMTVTGCLSSAGGRYVLTELEGTGTSAGSGQATTETYQLTDADEKLRDHVGKQVRVNGHAEPARIAEVRESTPPAPATATGTAGAQSGNQPTVSSETQTRLELRRMEVLSVQPTGEDCPAGTTTGPAR
jgi:hypothetical protein